MQPVEDAIHTELIAASGLTGDRIIYEDQSRDALVKDGGGSRAFMTMRVFDLIEVAPATPRNTVRDNPSPSAGAEILIGTSGDVNFTVRVTYYAGPASGAGAAYTLLRSVVRRLGLDSVSANLAAVQCAFVECVGGIRSVPTVLETEFESRAVADLRFRMLDSAEAPETYIQTVEITGSYS